jgi:putative redox protein
MDASVTWQRGMTFSGTANTGFQVPLGADPQVGGDNDGFRPLELMAVSLAGCTAMDVVSILRKKQQRVTAFEVKVHSDQAPEHPHVFTHAVITYQVTGHDLNENALRRAVELSATKYCPAQAMLSKVVPIVLEYEIYEGENAEVRQLVMSGTFDF